MDSSSVPTILQSSAITTSIQVEELSFSNGPSMGCASIASYVILQILSEAPVVRLDKHLLL